MAPTEIASSNFTYAQEQREQRVGPRQRTKGGSGCHVQLLAAAAAYLKGPLFHLRSSPLNEASAASDNGEARKRPIMVGVHGTCFAVVSEDFLLYGSPLYY